MPRILYTSAGDPTSSGGAFNNLMHVKLLRRLGFDSWILRVGSEFDLSANQRIPKDLPVLHLAQMKGFHSRDIVVIPEPHRAEFEFFGGLGLKTVMHNQNPFYTFYGSTDIHEVHARKIDHIITTGPYTSRFLRQCGYTGQLHEVRPVNLTEPVGAVGTKQLQIAYMPRKRPGEAEIIRGILGSIAPDYRRLPWVPIEKKSFQQVSDILRDSAIFLSLSRLEGLGLPPLEAMASQCIVVGFHGFGGLDYATNQNGFWVEESDFIAAANALVEAVNLVTKEPHRYRSMRESAMNTSQLYSMDAVLAALNSAWTAILGESAPDYRADQ